MKTKFLAALCASAACLAAVPTQASVVYDNGPIDGTITAWTLSAGQTVTDSFTLTGTTTITGFTFGGWSTAGTQISSVDYGFSSTLGGALTGTSALTFGAVVPGTGFGGSYDVRDYTGSVAPITLGAGTWYFSLGNSITTNNDVGYWDINNGPSSAYVGTFDLAGYYGPTGSSAFTLTGGAVPEPASWAMMVGGFGLIGGAMRARRTNISFA
ncbi:MAG TPA: PEPxxWA-CTERM sorting domain-containing protein [Sphingomonas sp.]|nr:PEPxxWA-CTERM sorting domain-containing protein [Sphingomonas sp.]